jgi:Fe-S-cluster-containing dehydrogenase component
LRRQDQDSPVVIDQELCVGCRACVLACPFGVIRMDKFSHTIIKCDQCADRLERGELPACVSACPTRALEFKDPDAVTREKKNAYLVEIAHSC